MAAKRKRKVDAENRQFCDNWTDEYCFVQQNSNIVCLLCHSTVAVAKISNLKRHYETRHPEFRNIVGQERTTRIESLRRSLNHQQNLFTKRSADFEAACEVSFDISLLIAKSGRPFTDGDFVKQCMLAASEKLCPEAANKLKTVSLNRMTVQRRISHLSADVTRQLADKAANFVYFSMAADESTDINSTAQLLVFVRGVSPTFDVTEELIGMASIMGQTTGSALLEETLRLCNSVSLDLRKMVSFTTDGAPAMTGERNGLVALLMKHRGSEGRELVKLHCIIHQQNLCSKDLGFTELVAFVAKTINFIKSRGLNHRQFRQLLDDSESDFHDLVYYCEVRWLSSGKMLKRFWELLDDVIEFLRSKDKNTEVDTLSNPACQADLTFLVDITQHLNDFNLKLQGQNQLVSQMASHVAAFRTKLQLFRQQAGSGNFVHFPTFQAMLQKNSDIDQQIYIGKLDSLIQSFNSRFKDFDKCRLLLKLFADPFGVSVDDYPSEFQMELIELQASDELHATYRENVLLDFYKTLPGSFVNLKDNALVHASMFGSTYCCEQTFSTMKLNKSNIRSQLTNDHLDAILRLSTTNFKPDISRLVGDMQHHPSH